MKYYRYDEKQIEYLKNISKNRFVKDITVLFNAKFDTELSEGQIKGCLDRNNIRTGVNTRFTKGHVAFNKGKKWDEYMQKESQEKSRKTTFKKGNTISYVRELFTERIDKDGYTYIKIEQPNKWVLKHRWVYEKEYGKIPENYNLIFADGNRRNFDLRNLVLVSDAELCIINKNNLMKEDAELTKTGVLIAKILDKTKNKT